MKRSAFLFCLFLIALFLPQAQAATYEIDAAHSSVGFKIKHLVSYVKGSFSRFSGQFEYDEANPAASGVQVRIQAASVDTNNERRDAHLRNPDFFEVETYPSITFVSKSVTADKIIGDLTLHGVTQEVALDYEYLGTAKDPWGGTRVGFTAGTVIDRKDFGMTYNKVLDQGGLLLGETVQVLIEIEGTLA